MVPESDENPPDLTLGATNSTHELVMAQPLQLTRPMKTTTSERRWRLNGDTACVTFKGINSVDVSLRGAYRESLTSLHLLQRGGASHCTVVYGLCLAFAAWARALRLPRGYHCPRSPQPSGHRCSPFDTVFLTHTPHSSRCVGGQAGCPVVCHSRTPFAAWCPHVTPKKRGGKPSRLQF
ncbi:unnamed protein product [Pleuronectes platessa]|uniref:Uncharacterized protein n=1 Tax=Pleuronectes platessa TaxID=8262 RepID=A0A9N7Z6G8_PLEPL|nr:unnamed protein product [Pleuronectes platessa]